MLVPRIDRTVISVSSLAAPVLLRSATITLVAPIIRTIRASIIPAVTVPAAWTVSAIASRAVVVGAITALIAFPTRVPRAVVVVTWPVIIATGGAAISVITSTIARSRAPRLGGITASQPRLDTPDRIYFAEFSLLRE